MASRYRRKQRALMRAVEILRYAEPFDLEGRKQLDRIARRLEEIALIVDDAVPAAEFVRLPASE